MGCTALTTAWAAFHGQWCNKAGARAVPGLRDVTGSHECLVTSSSIKSDVVPALWAEHYRFSGSGGEKGLMVQVYGSRLCVNILDV